MNLHPHSSPSPAPHHRSTNRCHVVHIALGTNIGGMEKLLVDFARYFDRDRFQLSFVSLQQRGALAAEIEAQQCTVHSLDKGSGIRPDVVIRLARLLRRLDAEIVHTHNAAAYVYGVPAAVLARIPRIVHTRHGQRYGALPRQARLFRFGARFVSRIVSVSEDARRLSIREGIPPEKTCTITNGIDIDRFSFSGPAVGGPAVVVARLSPEKDVATLLHAAARVVRRVASFQLNVVGDGSCRPELERLAGELDLRDVVQFLGERRDVPEILFRCALFVLPSRTEGISLTLLEAMARGLPAIATRVGGNGEVIVDGETGILVPPGDSAALADAIGRLYRDRERARQMAIAGRRRVEQLFTVGRMVRQYEQMYTSLSSAGRAGAGRAATAAPHPPQVRQVG